MDYNTFSRPLTDPTGLDVALSMDPWNIYPWPDGRGSISAWKSLSGQDAHSTQTPANSSVRTTGDILFYYNDSSSSNSIVNLPAGTYIALDASSYSGSVTLSPFTSIILLRQSDSSTTTPTVTTTAITNVSTYTATGGGNVTHDGSIALTYKGICWSTSIDPTTVDASYLNASTGEGSYISYLTGLNASTHYYVRAFAYNNMGISYGIDVSFNTLSSNASTSAPTVTTTAITNVSTYTATGGGNVTHDGSIALTYRGICWGTSIDPTVTDSSTRDTSTGEGSYISYLTGLNASTHYYVRAFAYNSIGTSYGIDVSFNTASISNPSVGRVSRLYRMGNKALIYGGHQLSF
jgi:hypothetical protein